MTRLEKYMIDNKNISIQEVINNHCPSEGFIDENMETCDNCSGVDKNWCKRCWECESDE